MELADLIVSAVIFEGDAPSSKEGVVEQLLLKLAEDGHISPADVPALLAEAMRRESLGSTGIGQGVAIPHAKNAAVPRLLGILGLFRPPVNFDSIDGEPADIIALLLAPRDPPGIDRRRASNVSKKLLRLFCDGEFRGRIRRARSAVEITELLKVSG